MYKPFNKDNIYNLDSDSLMLYSDEGLVSPGQITFDNFFYFNGENSLEQVDDTSENLKRMKPIFSKDYKSAPINSYS
jgi:hypothetical protein